MTSANASYMQSISCQSIVGLCPKIVVKVLYKQLGLWSYCTTRQLSVYLCLGGYVIVDVCLSVCLLATLHKNFQTDLHEIFREDWQQANEQLIKFWGRCRSPSGYRDCFPDSILLGDRESLTALKAWLCCNYDVITSPAQDSSTATAALHTACSVTGTQYCETVKTGSWWRYALSQCF